MFSVVCSGAIQGIQAYPVWVEVDISPGMPGFQLVGSLGGEVRESRERVRVALRNAGVHMPPMCVHVNLAPADIRKEGTGYDLAIAVGVLVSMGYLSKEQVEQVMLVGELGLNGEIRPVKGILPLVNMAKEQGMHSCIIPFENKEEGALIQGIKVVGVAHVKEVLAYLSAPKELQEEVVEPTTIDIQEMLRGLDTIEQDFGHIHGQVLVKRAAQIAAAGFHNLLLIGPPGTGKTMIASSMAGILPPLSLEECMEITTIYSVAGMLPKEQPLIGRRPFVNPHHTMTRQALVGGGMTPRPGAVSLAHHGILFLDELTEFPRNNLNLLRQPLEERKIMIARNKGQYTYPANFMLVGACNPCPCGYYPDLSRCRCSEPEIRRYLNKISGPLLDRFDLCVETPQVKLAELQRKEQAESSLEIRERIGMARKRQEKRFAHTPISFNAQMSGEMVERFCQMDSRAETMMEEIYTTLQLSARSYHRMLKTARTIADMADAEEIREEHIKEAVCYRQTIETFWR